jgi:NADH:ubiquinone oxidoreductase subunit 6 (subunit J)
MRKSFLIHSPRHLNLYSAPQFALPRVWLNSNAVLLPAVQISAAFSLLTLLVVPSYAVTSWLFHIIFLSATEFSWNAFGELVLPLGAGISAAAVSAFRNPMHSLLALLSVFFSTALLYLIAGLAFVGVVFLIVYVGAVAVLFLFVIMLLNVKSLTPLDPLLRHMSQSLAIVVVILLLLQIHFILTGSLEHAFAIGFLLESLLEPTTSEAVSFFVRFQAMDINALTALYTLHGVLFLVLTSILLVALLGAIILATVTTERATSISDLRRYSSETPLAAPVLSFSFFILGIFNDGLDALITFVSVTDIDPIFMSFYYEEAQRDTELRTSRKIKQDTYDAHSFEVDTEQRPLRRCLRARFGAPESEVVGMFGEAKSEEAYSQDYKRTYKRVLAPSNMQRRNRKTSKHLRAVTARAALIPVIARCERGLFPTRIMRYRWLWRWRRNRAASLRRLVIEYAELTRYVSRKTKEMYYPRIPTDNADIFEKVKYKYDYFKRIILRRKPPFRLFGKRRIPLSRLLRLTVDTKFYAWLFYWSWRIRAFCSYFMCFLALLPFVITVVWLFADKQADVLEELLSVYRCTCRVLHDYSALKYLDQSYSNTVAALIIIPAAAYAAVYEHPWLFLGTVLLFAWDAMTSHGGEFSDAEFQESRCNYWRKNANDHNQFVLDALAAEALIKSRIHPDKDRSDLPPVIVGLFPDWMLPIIDNILFALWWLMMATGVLVNFLTDFLQLPQAYRCVCGVLRIVRDTLKSIVPALFEKYPALADLCTAIHGDLLVVRTWLFELCQLIWMYICRGFYKIEYRPALLDAIEFYRSLPYSVVLCSVILAAALYFIATFLVLLSWNRVYSGVLVRRPSVMLYTGLFVASLYTCAVLFQKTTPMWVFKLRYTDLISTEVLTLYHQSRHMYIEQLCVEHPYLALVTFTLVADFFYRIRERKTVRDSALAGQSLVFRSYYNYWLRMLARYDADKREDYSEEVGPIATKASYDSIAADARLLTQEEIAATDEELRRMIWVRVKYIPKYYDPHPDVKFLKHRWAYAYVVEDHYNNPHCSV